MLISCLLAFDYFHEGSSLLADDWMCKANSWMQQKRVKFGRRGTPQITEALTQELLGLEFRSRVKAEEMHVTRGSLDNRIGKDLEHIN